MATWMWRTGRASASSERHTADMSSTAGSPGSSRTCERLLWDLAINATRYSETGEGFQTSEAPSGLSQVPFLWRNGIAGRKRRMEAIGGLIGVTQDPETLALRPKVGWAVREAEKMEVLLGRLAEEHTTFPVPRMDQPEYLPADLGKFYYHTAGAELFGRGGAAACRIVAVGEIEPLDWGEEVLEENCDLIRPHGRIWHRFAWLADGGWLAINLDYNQPDARPRPSRANTYSSYTKSYVICHGHTHTQGQPGQNPVVAASFIELLERMLDSGGRPYWLNPKFVSYGDAEQYTRRDT
jgi:hypothetical protein